MKIHLAVDVYVPLSDLADDRVSQEIAVGIVAVGDSFTAAVIGSHEPAGIIAGEVDRDRVDGVDGQHQSAAKKKYQQERQYVFSLHMLFSVMDLPLFFIFIAT